MNLDLLFLRYAIGLCVLEYKSPESSRKRTVTDTEKYSRIEQFTVHTPIFLHTKLYPSSQSRSINLPLPSLMPIQRVSFLSGLPDCHLRKVDVFPSSQYWSDGDGSTLDAEYLYRPIQLPGALLHIAVISVDGDSI